MPAWPAAVDIRRPSSARGTPRLSPVPAQHAQKYGLVPVPPGVVTVHFASPVTPAGTRAVIRVAETIVNDVDTLRSCTFDAPKKFWPLSVISAPARPLAGEKPVIVGARMTAFWTHVVSRLLHSICSSYLPDPIAWLYAPNCVEPRFGPKTQAHLSATS